MSTIGEAESRTTIPVVQTQGAAGTTQGLESPAGVAGAVNLLILLVRRCPRLHQLSQMP